MRLDKKQNRLRRARKGRSKIRELEVSRLSVHRTPRHIYAQIIAADGGTVLASASSLEADVRKGTKSGGNDLRVDVARCAVHAQAAHFQLADLRAAFARAAQTILFLVQSHDLKPVYFFFASLMTTRSSE